MKTVTREMVRLYNLRKLGYDFMGYNIHNVEKLSFHHLIVPKRDCKAQGLGDGYYKWNGAILVQETSHDYLHIIERIDRDMFLEITKLMIEQNKNEKLDLESLKRIREILQNIDVLIDGRFILEKRDITLKLRGSKNQRILYKGTDF